MLTYQQEQTESNVYFQFKANKLSAEEKLWLRQALKECIAYGEHGHETELSEDGSTICLNCSNVL